MKNIEQKALIFICIIFFAAQAKIHAQEISTIKIRVADAPKGFIIKLYELELNIEVLKDSAFLDPAGYIFFNVSLTQEGIYIIKPTADVRIPVIMHPNDSINISFSWPDVSYPSVINASEPTKALIRIEQKRTELAKNIEILYKSKHPKTDSLFGVYIAEHRNYLEEIIKNNRTSLISLWAIQQTLGPVSFFNIDKDEVLFENLSRTLLASSPNNKNVRAFHQNVSQYLREKRIEEEIEKRVGIGRKAPDIVLLNPDSVPLKLYDLKGKTILLKFWNPNCDLCREENRTLKKLYEKYHPNGFEVFSVSIGTVREEWLYALQEDNISVWYNVKIPEEGTNIPNTQSHYVALYGIRSIPYSFLIDNEGTIVKKDFDMKTLEKWLEWHYSSPFLDHY